jgi:hypothetical protein
MARGAQLEFARSAAEQPAGKGAKYGRRLIREFLVVGKTVVIESGADQTPARRFKRWLFAGLGVKGTQGPHTEEKETAHPWWKVMCLAGMVARPLADGHASAGRINSVRGPAYLPARRDASDFSTDLNIHGFEVGHHRVLRGESAAAANAIAGLLLYLRDDKEKVPHAYFNWTEGNPLLYLVHYVLSGEGDVAPVTREVLRKANLMRNADRQSMRECDI